jgi:hypothetical protein
LLKLWHPGKHTYPGAEKNILMTSIELNMYKFVVNQEFGHKKIFDENRIQTDKRFDFPLGQDYDICHADVQHFCQI